VTPRDPPPRSARRRVKRTNAVGRIDDLHSLRWNATSGIAISSHFKYIANEYPGDADLHRRRTTAAWPVQRSGFLGRSGAGADRPPHDPAGMAPYLSPRCHARGNAGLRRLPIRVSPMLGEGLDSWLEALSRRLLTPSQDLFPALGLTTSARSPAGVHGVPAQRRSDPGRSGDRCRAGLSPGDDAGSLRRNRARGGPGEPTSQLGAVVAPRYGSRFCPACLGDNGGRWLLRRRPGWSFACTHHQCLLADSCPACGRIPAATPYGWTCPKPADAANTPAPSPRPGSPAPRPKFTASRLPVAPSGSGGCRSVRWPAARSASGSESVPRSTGT
jgi:hypothetical protein